MLFGNEFDADEGAEVGGGLRAVESIISHVSFDVAGDVHGVTENLAVEQTEVWVEADSVDFVFAH